MNSDVIALAIVLGVAYIVGYGHGAWMAYTTPIRFRRWAETVCGKAYESVMDTYEKGAAK